MKHFFFSIFFLISVPILAQIPKLSSISYSFLDEKGARHSEILPFSTAKSNIALSSKQSLYFFQSDGKYYFSAKIPATWKWEYLDLHFAYHFGKNDKVYADGYQSWTHSDEKTREDKILPLAKIVRPMMQYYGDYTFAKTEHKKGEIYGWQYGYVHKENGKYVLLGGDNNNPQITFDFAQQQIRIRQEEMQMGEIIDSLKTLQMTLLIAEGTQNEVFDSYFNPENRPIRPEKAATGWTSWYYYYTGINHQIITENLAAFSSRKIPIDFFQIDDGWQMAVGDWQKVNQKFPKGMKPIADSIHACGYKAGLWLAPLICEKKSALAKQHPDWILRDDKGKKVVAGYNPGWSGNYYALDFYKPEVRAYIYAFFDTVLEEWDFDMVKLDFLFAASAIPHHGYTRSKNMADAMALLRDACGEKIILGCGVPLTQAMGEVEYCRIGPDMGLTWDNKMFGKTHFREYVSTEKALKNTIFRAPLNGRAFQNDPDVYILRDPKTKLTPDQKYSLFVVNQILGGLLFTSDNITEYNETQMRLFQQQFPFSEKKIDSVFCINKEVYGIHFSIQEKKYFALVNLSKNSPKLRFPANHFVWLEPETKQPILYQKNDGIILRPFETRIFTAFSEENIAILTSDKHLFPASECESLSISGENITIQWHQTAAEGVFWLQVPEGKNYLVNGKDCQPQEWNGKWILRGE